MGGIAQKEWRSAVDGFCQVSRDGEVIGPRGKPLRLQRTDGSLTVKVAGKNHYVHRLVATAYIPNPDNLPHVKHKNKDGLDNRVENLEWFSRFNVKILDMK